MTAVSGLVAVGGTCHQMSFDAACCHEAPSGQHMVLEQHVPRAVAPQALIEGGETRVMCGSRLFLPTPSRWANVLLICQVTTPPAARYARVVGTAARGAARDLRDYAAINKMENVIPGPPLGLRENAKIVRVNSATLAGEGPVVDVKGAVGGYMVVEAEDLDDAIAIAARVPAARHGGAVEVRPVATYW
jgi:hypothetical protein